MTNCLPLFSTNRIACLGSVLGIAMLMAARLNADEAPPTQPASAATKKADEEKIDFARDVQPIFKHHCLSCHGPDKQKSSYRLDVKSVAFAGGDFGEAPIVAGKSEESRLIDYVIGKNDMVMPPEGQKLSTTEIATLRAWIDQGAVWPDSLAGDKGEKTRHWSFQPVVRPVVPQPQPAAQPVRNPIDAFVFARLEENGLAPSPEADRRTLVRRLYFDVVGLPPSPEEIEQFVGDQDPLGYEKLVDRLLASPHFGERWARHWLDVVRFAESNGFEMNQPRPNAWPYRDYVIRAFNEDLPYDRFIREQLAGDALGVDEATGFLVGGPWDQVKSPDPVLTAQQRADELHDMTSTTGSAFLGLTVGCARCHSHKFDPISQADYYAVTAALAGVTHGERPLRPKDWLDRERKIKELDQRLAPILARQTQLQPLSRVAATLVLDDAQPAGDSSAPGVEELLPPRGVAAHAPGDARGFANQPGDGSHLPNLGKNYHWWEGVADQPVFAYSPRIDGRCRVWLSWGCGWHTHAQDVAYVLDGDGNPATTDDQREIARVDQRRFAEGGGEPYVDKPLWSGFFDAGEHDFRPTSRLLVKAGATTAPVTADAVIFEQLLEPSAVRPEFPALRAAVHRGENVDRFPPIKARRLRFEISATDSGIEPCLDELEVFSTQTPPRNVALATAGTKVRVSGTLPGYAIHQPQHVNDGRYGNERSWISHQRGKGWVELEFAELVEIDRAIWSRDRDSRPRYEDRLPTRYEIKASADGETWQTVSDSADRLDFRYPHKRPDIEVATGLSPNEVGELETLKRQRDEIEAQISQLAASEQKAYAGIFVSPPKTHRLHRGDPMQPREEISPGGLTEFGGGWRLPPEAPEQERRLALARWIASPDNPLTARVMANRLWHYHFGQGIVTTPSDFGVNGARPSHPELLDWLASELVSPSAAGANAWSLKHLHRLILLSSTYRQSSRASGAGLARDAQARLLWRHPPRRLEAEAIRDAILSVSGKLDLKAGGPGFELFEPNTNYVRVYTPKREFGPETFRRMIYQNKPRMQLDDTFGAFDCPDAGQIAPRRNASTTPLQAVNLLNSPFVVQQAQLFAERLQHDSGADAGRQVRRAFLLALSREPADDELAASLQLIEQHGLAIFCRAILNANEFVMLY